MVAQNPFKTLFQSRKFWVLILDVVTSTILFFVAKYAPNWQDDVKFLVLTYQPVFLLVIYGIYAEDNQIRKSASEVESSKSYYLSDSNLEQIKELLKSSKTGNAEIGDSLKLPRTSE